MKNEVEKLRAENRRLRGLLNKHGIKWQIKAGEESKETRRKFTSGDKIKLFRDLFRGRKDVFALRWEAKSGKSGYSPACANEWKPGVCGKPRVKCGSCNTRKLLPLTDSVIYDHLSGKHTIGVYPLLQDDSCRFLAVDFDGGKWREESLAYRNTCAKFEVPAYLEVSRSGRGAHVWVFFSEPVPAFSARRLGSALISETCRSSCLMSLESYDRFFPNQDTLPQGGFGNLVALPLQKMPRQNGCSVFVDDGLEPYDDQWDYLSGVKRISCNSIDSIADKLCGKGNALDVDFVDTEQPWQRRKNSKIQGRLPAAIQIVEANGIYVRKANVPRNLINRIIRLAAFQNPEFYRAQAMRLPVWNKPRIICCAENFDEYIRLPRGCGESLAELMRTNGISLEKTDKRLAGKPLKVSFRGVLREDQQKALSAILRNDIGVLSAPTAFGKTVLASALIARRQVSTLVLVHRTALMRQWVETLSSFLEGEDSSPGFLGGGRKKPTGKIDIGVIQSMSKMDSLGSFLDDYGQVIVDECHHISAFSFESILRESKAKFVTGLTATPVRRDGHHPIVFMQCGPIRHRVTKRVLPASSMEVWPRPGHSEYIPQDAPVQEVFRYLINSSDRNRRIAQDTLEAYSEGRKILVLTERTGHLLTLNEMISKQAENTFLLYGRMTQKQRREEIGRLKALDESNPLILIATGRLIGEGFDHPPLDTLVLAMPVSWRGTLQQYAGRLHRDHQDKQSVRIYDYTENTHPILRRMWDKRLKGYKAIGYTLRGEKGLFE
ncbi:DEAD/DEAH box helicase [Candidatus Fermentibacteria bacterium]|nr:MAG: DEAD/DEAH box helicase [Candidatus Fermentibacteria bacterium]